MSQFFASGGQSIRVSASTSVLSMNIQDWILLGWTGWISLQSKGLSRVFSNNHSSKASILQCSAFFIVKLSYLYMTTGKTIALTWWTYPTKVHLVKAMAFPGVTYGCASRDYKERWWVKNWCFWTVVLEKTLESPLDCKEIQPVHHKGNTPWTFTGRTDAEAETLILWPPDAKNWLTGKDPDIGKDWRQEEKGMTGWDGWMASPTQCTSVWANSMSWWWTGKPGMLQSVGLLMSWTQLSNWI